MSEEKNESAKTQSSVGDASAGATFLQFISGMAAQGLMHLGLMTNPLTGKAEQDIVNAKYSIELLSVLRDKTKGNLTSEEDEYLSAALYELQMRYVQVMKQGEMSTDKNGAASSPNEDTPS